jgi:hypothetical protein
MTSRRTGTGIIPGAATPTRMGTDPRGRHGPGGVLASFPRLRGSVARADAPASSCCAKWTELSGEDICRDLEHLIRQFLDHHAPGPRRVAPLPGSQLVRGYPISFFHRVRGTRAHVSLWLTCCPRASFTSGPQRFQLEHFIVGEGFHVAAEIGIGGAGAVHVPLHEGLVAEQIGHPAARAEKADLLGRRPGRILSQSEFRSTPGPARIAHVGVGARAPAGARAVFPSSGCGRVRGGRSLRRRAPSRTASENPPPPPAAARARCRRRRGS